MTASLRAGQVRRYSLEEAKLLTPRQWQVLELVAQGFSNEAIGAQLCLSALTIKYHLAAIFQTLDVTSKLQAVVWFYAGRVWDSNAI